MLYEPDTVWGRTVDGDREVDAPQSGLSLPQRRLLTRLKHPRPFAVVAAQCHLDPPKLENELIALAQLHLVAYQRPGATRPRTTPSVNLPLHLHVVACQRPGATRPRTTPSIHPPLPKAQPSQAISIAILLPLCVAAAALGIASVLLIMT